MALSIPSLTTRIERSLRLIAVEKAAIAYTLITTVLIFFLYGRLDHPAVMLGERAAIMSLTAAVYGVYYYYPCRFTVFLRIATQMALLAYWYPDTYEFNRLFPNLDPIFAQADQLLFGCQPALEFAKLFPTLLVSEAFNMGYFLYYPLILVVMLYYFLFKNDELERAGFILTASFFAYYLIYIALPVAGPQFYFRAVGLDLIQQGIFPYIGDYFHHNTFLIKDDTFGQGFFYQLVENSQEVGERPTAAFPSSHVGISTIVMFLAYRVNRKLTYILLPIYLLLCGATVYIQAHYLVDSIAGFFSAILLYICMGKLIDKGIVR